MPKRLRRKAAIPRGEHAHGRVRKTANGGLQHAVLGVLGGRGCDEYEWRVARRQLDVGGGRLPHERPDDVHMLGPLARILELGIGGDQSEPLAYAAVDVAECR